MADGFAIESGGVRIDGGVLELKINLCLVRDCSEFWPHICGMESSSKSSELSLAVSQSLFSHMESSSSEDSYPNKEVCVVCTKVGADQIR